MSCVEEIELGTSISSKEINRLIILLELKLTPHKLESADEGKLSSFSENPVALNIAILIAFCAASPFSTSPETNLSSKLATTQTRVCLGKEGADVGCVVGKTLG